MQWQGVHPLMVMVNFFQMGSSLLATDHAFKMYLVSNSKTTIKRIPDVERGGEVST